MKAQFCEIVAMTALWLCSLAAQPASCEEILFEDNFKDKLSDKWQVVGLTKDDYRIRDGGLEMRVQPGTWTSKMPMLKIKLPFEDSVTVIVSVKVTLLDQFTQDGEFAGVQLVDEDGSVFKATKERKNGKLVFTPGEVEFIGKAGEEGDVTKYKTIFVDESPEAGPLRIIVDHGYAFFQVGPSSKDKYHNHFYSAIRHKPNGRGFALITAGAPSDSSHWVRFENFRVFTR